LRILVIVAAGMGLFLVSCASKSRNFNEDSEEKIVTEVLPLNYFPESEPVPTAMVRGRFVVEDKGCLVFAQDSSSLRYSPVLPIGSTIERDSKNRPVGLTVRTRTAKLGTLVIAGGAITPYAKVKPDLRCPPQTVVIGDILN
jgi:hypothetical protein